MLLYRPQTARKYTIATSVDPAVLLLAVAAVAAFSHCFSPQNCSRINTIRRLAGCAVLHDSFHGQRYIAPGEEQLSYARRASNAKTTGRYRGEKPLAPERSSAFVQQRVSSDDLTSVRAGSERTPVTLEVDDSSDDNSI